MVRRFAAQYIYVSGEMLPRHVVEIETKDNSIIRIFSLDKEYSNTEFFNGIIVVFSDAISLPEINKELDLYRNKEIIDFLELFKKNDINVFSKNIKLVLIENIDFLRMKLLPDTQLIMIVN